MGQSDQKANKKEQEDQIPLAPGGPIRSQVEYPV